MSDTGRSGGPLAAEGEPASLGQLFSLIFKQFLKTLPLQIVMGLVVIVVVWLLHTYLVVGPNEGFNQMSGTFGFWFLAQILALQGRVASGGAFWFAFMTLASATISGMIRRKGEFFKGLGQVPARIAKGMAGGGVALAAVMCGAGVSILLVAGLSNRVLAVVVIGLALLALGEGPYGFGAIVLRCIYNDGRKTLSKPPQRLPETRSDAFIAGVMFGAAAYVVLFLLPDIVFTGLGFIAVVGAVVLVSQGTRAAAGTTGALLLGFLVLAGARAAFADDGGLAEAGGTWGQWLTSEGAIPAVGLGLPAAIGALLGAALGAISSAIGSLVSGWMDGIAEGYIPVGPEPGAPPVTPVPAGPLGPMIPGLDLLGPIGDFISGTFGAGQTVGSAIGTNLPGIINSGPFDIIKNMVGTSSTLWGTLSEFGHVVDSPETIQNIKNAMNAWHKAPSPGTGQAYVKAIGQTADARVGAMAGAFDKLGKGLDIIEAVGKGLGEAEKEGFTGTDKALIIASELGKKGLTWVATKNPIVGVIDWGVGTTTQALWGKDKRIDIGAGIEKAGDAAKNLAKEAGDYAGGGPEANAQSQVADQLSHSLKRIKQQVADGKITRAEGSARAKKLQGILMGGN